MELAIVLMIILIVVGIAAIKLNTNEIAFPFRGKNQLFSPAERQFLNLIESAMGNEFRVISRVRLSDLLALSSKANSKSAKSAINKAGLKQLDYVLCSKDDMTPVLAIDLVHNLTKEGHKLQRDFFVNGALDTAGIPHARIKVKQGYTLAEVRDCLEAKLVPLRKKQGKFATVEARSSIIKPHNKPTRPIRTNRQVAA